ncbi:MAG: hypothetical protein M1837_005583 [Sclerophora amabilis]|nr:MAG: hypothetical protein M1837_005583 [Sclerophora amabilis]
MFKFPRMYLNPYQETFRRSAQIDAEVTEQFPEDEAGRDIIEIDFDMPAALRETPVFPPGAEAPYPAKVSNSRPKSSNPQTKAALSQLSQEIVNESSSGSQDDERSGSRSDSFTSTGSSSEDDSRGEESEEGNTSSTRPSKDVNQKTKPLRAKSSRSPTNPLSQAATSYTRPRAPFKPPNGFQSVPTPSDSSPRARQTFSKSNLAGKQIWYITAPDSVPVEELKEVALDSVASSQPVLRHNGREYGFVPDNNSARDRSRLLVPDDEGVGYRLASSQFSQALRLQQLVRLPNLTRITNNLVPSSENTDILTLNSTKAPRKQPKGLRMRFLPSSFHNDRLGTIGSSSSSSGERSDEELGTVKATASFRIPPEIDSGAGTRRRKSKSRDNAERNQPSSQLANEGEPRRKKSKQRHHRIDDESHVSLPSSSSQPNGIVPSPADGSLDIEKDFHKENGNFNLREKGTSPLSKSKRPLFNVNPSQPREPDQEHTRQKEDRKERHKGNNQTGESAAGKTDQSLDHAVTATVRSTTTATEGSPAVQGTNEDAARLKDKERRRRRKHKRRQEEEVGEGRRDDHGNDEEKKERGKEGGKKREEPHKEGLEKKKRKHQHRHGDS